MFSLGKQFSRCPFSRRVSRFPCVHILHSCSVFPGAFSVVPHESLSWIPDLAPYLVHLYHNWYSYIDSPRPLEKELSTQVNFLACWVCPFSLFLCYPFIFRLFSLFPYFQVVYCLAQLFPLSWFPVFPFSCFPVFPFLFPFSLFPVLGRHRI